MAAVRPSRERADFWRWLLTYRCRSRPLLLRAIAAHAGDAEIHVLRTPQAVSQFIARIASGPADLPLTQADADGALNRVRRQGRSIRGRCGHSSRGWRCIKIQVGPVAPGNNRAANDARSIG